MTPLFAPTISTISLTVAAWGGGGATDSLGKFSSKIEVIQGKRHVLKPTWPLIGSLGSASPKPRWKRV